MNFEINKMIEFSPFFLRPIPHSLTYPLFSAITITMVEKFKRQDCVIQIILLPAVDPALSELGGEQLLLHSQQVSCMR